MKKHFTLLIFLLVVTTSLFAFKKTVLVSCSESDAKIFQDGKYIGTGQVQIVIVSKSSANIEARKVGYLTEKVKFFNNRYSAKPPKTYYIEMRRDDSYDASTQTDISNTDIELKTSKEESAAWKLISQIVTSNFDIIEITDRETGYLRTAWVAQSFDQKTVRSRFIVKQSSYEPLVYKIKLISEHSEFKGTSIKKDEDFREWDRVLRKYENLITELTSRLK
jgi:hypothetical protein